MKPDYIDKMDPVDAVPKEDNDNDPKDTPPVKIMVSLIAKVDYKLTDIFIHRSIPFSIEDSPKPVCSAYNKEKNSLVFITPEENDFKRAESFLPNICEGLNAKSCSIAIKADDCLKVEEFCFSKDSALPSINSTTSKLLSISNGKIDLKKDILRYIKRFYISKGLLIRDINSKEDIPNDAIDYARDILEKAINGNSQIMFPQATDPIHHMMYFPGINPDIPILLKDDMPSYEEQWKKIDDDRKKEYIPKGKVLGYYTKYDEENFCKGPHIVLGPEIIKKSSEEKSIPFEVLFTKVLVHELAHAMMDNSNNWPSSLEAKAMEESLANKITLNWFRLFAPNEFKYVKHYIDKYQPAIYKFGIWQDYADVDWKKWRESNKQSSQKLKEWFNKCFSNGRIKIPIEDYTKDIYDSVFE